MAKIYGLFGSMTGKLADTVMSVRNGEQIARKYQPVVYNPSTEAQVAQRAKLKLLSQLSAVMAPVIAIRRDGSVSSRNLFTKVNFPLTSYATNEANITLANIQLTRSVVSLGALNANPEQEGCRVWVVSSEAATNLDRVIYAMFAKTTDNKLRYVTSRTATAIGTGHAWEVVFPALTGNVVVLAYGVRDNTNTARAAFGNLTAATAESVAKLLVSRMLSESDVTVTETRGIEIAPANSRHEDDEEEKTTRKNSK